MATGRLAVLSNVNMNMVIRMLQKQAEVYDAEGYGNELGALLNPASSYHAFQPDITFLIMDLAELLEHDYDPQTAKERIGSWFQTLEGCLPEHGVFYVFRTDRFAVNKKLMVGNILPLIVSELEVQDIDNLTDWKIAEMKYRLMTEEK